VIILEADTTDPASIAKLKETISNLTSCLDQVIYNAGVLKGFAPLTKADVGDFKQNMEVNVYGAHIVTVAFFPFVMQSVYKNRVFAFIGSSFGSVNTAQQNFDMHSQAFGTPGANPTAIYDISKVGCPINFNRRILYIVTMNNVDRGGEASFGIRHGTPTERRSYASLSSRAA
jgi:NAD(P)-dependent dehydrogenase (short-subunit alcohol dehydrogenase family)